LHDATFGWKEGRYRSPSFDTKGYLTANADVKAAGIDPLAQLPAVGRTGITPRRITEGLARTLAGLATTLAAPVRR
jgi:hypothetical protein